MEIGERHGRLVCIGKDPDKDERYYLFKCDCGNVKSIISYNVRRGATISCGCYQKANRESGNCHRTYGFSHTRIDHIYKSMMDRCENPKNYGYHKYGGRGIRVCNEWKTNKTAFFEWAFANGYAEDLTIDRKDNSKGYSPENCRWISYQEQNNNRRSNHHETIDGETHTLAEWSRISGIKSSTIWQRLHSGWNTKDAVFKPIERRTYGKERIRH